MLIASEALATIKAWMPSQPLPNPYFVPSSVRVDDILLVSMTSPGEKVSHARTHTSVPTHAHTCKCTHKDETNSQFGR